MFHTINLTLFHPFLFPFLPELGEFSSKFSALSTFLQACQYSNNFTSLTHFCLQNSKPPFTSYWKMYLYTLIIILSFRCQGMREFINYICNTLKNWSRSTPVFSTVYQYLCIKTFFVTDILLTHHLFIIQRFW